MCGRFTLRTPSGVLVEQFGLSEAPTFKPRFNVAPSQAVAAVRGPAQAGGREFAWLRWGLVPRWANEASIGNRLINARSETAATKPAFKNAFRHRRCLILADGFYEWRHVEGKRLPYFFGLRDGRPFAFAGLWEHWQGAGEPIESCTVLTTAANDLVHPLHDRMPVILDPRDYATWLDPAVSEPERLVPLLRPYPADLMARWPVATHVNRPENDAPSCVEPVEEERPIQTQEGA
jgi:putative SOS response-associated peptidase YedK